ncbi:hypothetical protein GNF10_26495 [Nostoc sp. UCD121]|uniref:hypothetical protein n=1 Tax=unclassified Nostoc TaxID=2593658 RepID=UPI0016236129|nr:MULTISPECIES: hypothetical protein [unclassified Nostoc]MBC1221828.1 hypothetical protein [Nostoc sp. UCD120]MBC1279412.1 hypothetical protein [Nostoc sp. UCD121]MBC1295921.1 hypothetical protein [Nostoc sp. UCD122]
MPHRHYPPAYLRYLRARLWNLGRPGFWVTAIFLSVMGLVTWEYWSNPDIFVYKQKNKVTSQTPTDSSLSAENRAIAADIDNLPVLFNDFEQATLPLTANTPKEKTEAKNSKSLLEDAINKQKFANDAKLNPTLSVNGDTPPAVQNPFVVQTENLLRTGTVNNNQFLGIKTLTGVSEPTDGEKTSSNLGIGFTNQTNKNQNSASVSPLQAILNQSTNQKLSGFNATTATQTNALGRASEPGTTLMPPMNSLSSQNSLPSAGLNTGTGYTSTGRNLQPNPYSNLNNGQVLPNNGLNTGASYTNLQQNPYSNLNNGQVLPNNGLNTGAGYTNLQQNPYNNLNNGQVVPNVAPGTLPVRPSNIAPYSSQIPGQSVVAPTNPMGYANYGLQQPTQPPQNYGNYGLQQPTQPPQNYGNYVQQQPTQSNSLYLRQLRDKYRSPGQN